MTIYNDYYTKARMAGKKKVADLLTQHSLSQMKPGQTFCLASINGLKYFKCYEPPKEKLKIWIDGCDDNG